MSESKSGLHYGWLIFVCSCLLAAGSMALTVSILGVFLLPASTNLGVNPGDFAMWATVSGFVSVITMPFWGQFMPKHTKACFMLGAILLIVAQLLFAFAPSLPVVIIAGCCVGAQMPILFTVGIPSIMGQWFVGNQRAKFLGIATAFSGVGTFVWAPLFAIIIQNTGVQMAYIIAAIISAILTLPMGFLAKWDPAEKGLKPIGYQEGSSEETEKADELATGVSAGRAMKTAAFWILFVAVGLGAVGMGFNSSQSAIANEFMAPSMGADAAALLGASMISAAAVGNMLGKIVFGIVCDKIGVRITNVIFLCLSVIAIVMWIFAPGQVTYLVAGFLFGTNNAVASVGLPLACRAVFGNKDYSKIWSRLCMISALIGGSATSIVSYIAQGGGSYTVACYFGIAMYVVIIIATWAAVGFSGKIKFDDQVAAR